MTQRIASLSIDRSFLDTVDLVSLIEQRSPTRFGKPSGNGTKRTVKGPCPWCSGVDRFAVFVNETPQRFYCGVHGNSGCNNKHGDAITFLREYEQKSFKQAYAELTGQDIPQATHKTYNTVNEEWKSKEWQEKAARFCSAAEKMLWEDDKGFEILVYLNERGFDEKTIKGARLGAALYNGALCLVIPWFDSKQGLYYRVELRDSNPDAEKRYKNYSGSSVSDGMYGTDSLLFNRPAVFLVEGALDALSIAQEASDLVSVLSTGSTGGSHHPKWLMRLANVPHVFVAFDAESKGEESAAYWLNALPNATRWRTPIGKDANEMLVRELDVRGWIEAALATLDEPQETIDIINNIEEPKKTRVFDASIPTELGALVTGLEDSTGIDWYVRMLPKGFTHADRVKELQVSREAQLKEDERATWAAIREALATVGIPRWLIPGTQDWHTQVARSGQREMLQRRQAWVDQQETSQDVVLAAEA